jgi:hypothetical protein
MFVFSARQHWTDKSHVRKFLPPQVKVSFLFELVVPVNTLYAAEINRLVQQREASLSGLVYPLDILIVIERRYRTR